MLMKKFCSLWMVPEIEHELMTRNVWVWWVGWVLPGVTFCRYYRAEIFHRVSLMCSSTWADFFKMWSLWMVFTLCRLSSLHVQCAVRWAVGSQSKRSSSHLSQTAPGVGWAASLERAWTAAPETAGWEEPSLEGCPEEGHLHKNGFPMFSVLLDNSGRATWSSTAAVGKSPRGNRS